MRILIMNWKDIHHCDAGGAEIATQRLAEELVKRKHAVKILTCNDGILPPTETINGVSIIRRGNRFTLYGHAFLYYLRFQRDIDIIIDQIHGVPFLTPVYSRKPILAYIHEIGGVIWRYEFVYPVAWLGRFLEKMLLRLYANSYFLTDAASTKAELTKLGIPRQHIHIIPLTIDKKNRHELKKTSHPSLAYLGRRYPMKRIELLIQSIYLIKQSVPNLKLTLSGKCKPGYMKKLTKLTNKLGLSDSINFSGPVSENDKTKLLAENWVHVHPSVKEGFGLTVLEAAACGTPTVAFAVPGLKDIIRDDVNGLLVTDNTATALAHTLKLILTDKRKLRQLSRGAWQWSRGLPTWSQQTEALEKLLFKACQQRTNSHPYAKT